MDAARRYLMTVIFLARPILLAAVDVWQVESGPCIMEGGCLQSSNSSRVSSGNESNVSHTYGAFEYCNITVNTTVPWSINVITFDTERLYDILTVNGEHYSWIHGPDGIMPTETITWTSDVSSSGKGWMLCPEVLGIAPTTTTTTTTAVHRVRRWPTLPRPSSGARMSSPRSASRDPSQASYPMLQELRSQILVANEEVSLIRQEMEVYKDLVTDLIQLADPIISLDQGRQCVIDAIKQVEEAAAIGARAPFPTISTPSSTIGKTCLSKRQALERSTAWVPVMKEYAESYWVTPLENVLVNLTNFQAACQEFEEDLLDSHAMLQIVDGGRSETAASVMLPAVEAIIDSWLLSKDVVGLLSEVVQTIREAMVPLLDLTDSISSGLEGICDAIDPVMSTMNAMTSWISQDFCFAEFVPSSFDVCKGGTYELVGYEFSFPQECMRDYLSDCTSLEDILNGEVCVTLPDVCLDQPCSPAIPDSCSLCSPTLAGGCDYYCLTSSWTRCDTASDCPNVVDEICPPPGCMSDAFGNLQVCIGVGSLSQIVNDMVTSFVDGIGLTDALTAGILDFFDFGSLDSLPDISGLTGVAVPERSMPNMMTNADGLLEVYSCSAADMMLLPPRVDPACQQFVEEAGLGCEGCGTAACMADDFSVGALSGLCECSARGFLVAMLDQYVKCDLRPACAVSEAGRTFGEQLLDCPIYYEEVVDIAITWLVTTTSHDTTGEISGGFQVSVVADEAQAFINNPDVRQAFKASIAKLAGVAPSYVQVTLSAVGGWDPSAVRSAVQIDYTIVLQQTFIEAVSADLQAFDADDYVQAFEAHLQTIDPSGADLNTTIAVEAVEGSEALTVNSGSPTDDEPMVGAACLSFTSLLLFPVTWCTRVVNS